MARAEQPGSGWCDCAGAPTRMVLDGAVLCDRCLDRRVAAITGYPELPEPPAPDELSGPDGRIHRFRYRLWRAPTGVVAEAAEIGDAPGEGYHVEVLGSHEADAGRLMERVRTRLRDRISHLDLKDRPGSHPIIAGDQLTGRLVWSHHDETYDVVIDGRRLTWTQFGHALEPFEGWAFRLAFEDTEMVEDGDG